MPVFNSDDWWIFVKSLLRLGFGFGLRMDQQSGIRTVVANSFYAKHNVDVLAVIANHRKQTRTEQTGGSIEQPTTIYNARKFGQYPATMRNCDLCPPGPAVLCVRQFGSQWRCMHGSARGLKPHTPRHRDYHNPIDMGYLDVDPPPSNLRSTMTLEELCEHDSFDNTMLIEDVKQGEEEEEQEEEHQQVHINLKKLPASHRQLIADLGFVPGVYEVTAQEMKKAWISAVEVKYLKSLQLSHCANDGKHMRSVRKIAHKLLANSKLQMQTRGGRVTGKRVNTFVIAVVL
jgi:hypothetical protein